MNHPVKAYIFDMNGIVAARAAGMSVVAVTFTNPLKVLEAAGANRQPPPKDPL